MRDHFSVNILKCDDGRNFEGGGKSKFSVGHVAYSGWQYGMMYHAIHTFILHMIVCPVCVVICRNLPQFGKQPVNQRLKKPQ